MEGDECDRYLRFMIREAVIATFNQYSKAALHLIDCAANSTLMCGTIPASDNSVREEVVKENWHNPKRHHHLRGNRFLCERRERETAHRGIQVKNLLKCKHVSKYKW